MITIVILIILATVAIQFAFGENGLINRAQDAKNYQANADAEENQLYKDAETAINEALGGKGGSETDGEDGPREVEGVKIPDGFYYVGGKKSEGIVISDKKEDLKKGTDHEAAKKLVGNQFVWIPVEDDEAFRTYEGYYDGSLDSILGDCSEPYDGGYVTEQAEYDAMKASVLEHNGFYVGRYEAGVDLDKVDTDADSIIEAAKNAIVVKQGQQVANDIGWSDSDEMTNEKGGAVELSKNFAKANNYTSVTSTLIYGVEWDAIMNFIDPKYAEGKCDTSSSFVANSTGKGNYNEDANTNPWKGLVTKTGASSDYAVKNIYDLGGNCAEWTMEAMKDSESKMARIGFSYGRIYRGRFLQQYRFQVSSFLS